MGIPKPLLLFIGFLCVGLGTAGMFLPVLPTTPFYLLATLCFAKSSEKFYCWFINTKLYKKHIESFVENRCMTMKTKLIILIPVSAMLLLTAVIMELPVIIRAFIILLILFKNWYFIFMIKTRPRAGIGLNP